MPSNIAALCDISINVEQFDVYRKGEIMAKLTGKVAVVTGASKGIGAGIAKALGAQGASVVVNYSSDKAGAERTVAEITKAGGKAIAIGASVAKSTDIDKLFTETKKAFGKV